MLKSLAVAAFVILLSCDVRAECWKSEDVEARLGEQWHEQVANVGVSNGELVRLYRNKETGSWTITITRGQIIECVISAGESWREVGEDNPT